MIDLGTGNILLLFFFVVLPLINFLLRRFRKRRHHQFHRRSLWSRCFIRRKQPCPVQHLVPPATKCIDRRRAPLPRLLTIVLPEDRF